MRYLLSQKVFASLKWQKFLKDIQSEKDQVITQLNIVLYIVLVNVPYRIPRLPYTFLLYISKNILPFFYLRLVRAMEWKSFFVLETVEWISPTLFNCFWSFCFLLARKRTYIYKFSLFFLFMLWATKFVFMEQKGGWCLQWWWYFINFSWKKILSCLIKNLVIDHNCFFTLTIC